MRPIIKRKYPEMKGLDITRQIGQAWNEVSIDEKTPYLELENDSKTEYKNAMVEWRQNQIMSAHSFKDLDEHEIIQEGQDDDHEEEYQNAAEAYKKSQIQQEVLVDELKSEAGDETEVLPLDGNDDTCASVDEEDRSEESSQKEIRRTGSKADDDEDTAISKNQQEERQQEHTDAIAQGLNTAAGNEHLPSYPDQQEQIFPINMINTHQDVQNQFLFQHRLPNTSPYIGSNAMAFHNAFAPGSIPLGNTIPYGQLPVVPNFFLDQGQSLMNPVAMNPAFLQMQQNKI